ncbi:hypothetical protein MICAF_840010 [Microcystis aeruginosa PCC 9807]|uniref:Uncharacterized protein n=1 Tax=Microcystis aeruginosa PCC 9807 TaxID=1160283 RepID=I4HEW4_MICAE|nr:hypothetical protein MICAF_840010 [Microcystis aeruginosa PCC 9807]
MIISCKVIILPLNYFPYILIIFQDDFMVNICDYYLNSQKI